jgi:Tfp pilus assembly protein PilP
MVTDNKGDGHVIKIGTPIGINRGVVYKIQSGEVIIKEEFRNYKDEKETRYVSKKAPSGM